MGIPKYAQGADYSRLVRVLCKKKCMSITYAEMIQPHPGWNVLKESDVFKYQAKCLKCGGIAEDPYNWMSP